jgi:demethylmenaquinone methyltransferase/2-methoxy-6-polyprenyl-1,4-benzoquinol methylase
MGILEDKANARQFYKYLSKVYDSINPFIWNAEMRDTALEWLELSDNDRVLDVGSGTGFGTEGLLEYTPDVHGLDQSIHQMQKAFEKFGRTETVKFYRGDAERLPFQANSFDAVWSSGSIEYWPNPEAALTEFQRVVRPGGAVLVVGPDYPNSKVFQLLADAIMLFYDETEAQRMFESTGFVDIEHHIQQAYPGSPRAITTVARAPESQQKIDTDSPSQTQVQS